MGKTLHVHIGWAKCASTTLQNMFARNQKQLMEQGYYYPIIGGVKRLGNGTPLWQAFDRGWKFLQRHPDLMDFDDVNKFFAENYLNTEHEHVLISSENFFTKAKKHDFSFMFDSFDAIKVYWVIRPRMLRAQSKYFHIVRNGRVKLEIGDYITDCEKNDQNPFPGGYMRCYNFWSSIAGDDGLKILMLQDGFPPIREQFLKALLGHVPDNFKLGNSRHQEIGPVPTAAIMSLEPDFDNYREYRQKIKHIRVTANRLGIKKQPFSVLTPDIVDRLNNMFQSDEAAFAAAQNEYTLENLRPDISKLVTSSATLASVRKWEDYGRLQAALAKDGIHV